MVSKPAAELAQYLGCLYRADAFVAGAPALESHGLVGRAGRREHRRGVSCDVDFRPKSRPTLGSFVYHQILGTALTRYRQEWTYATRYGASAIGEVGVTPVEDRFAIKQEEEELTQNLTDLPDEDRSLIKDLYWQGFTESEVASGLGISQQAVNRRKRKILDRLRESFDVETATPKRKRRKPKL